MIWFKNVYEAIDKVKETANNAIEWLKRVDVDLSESKEDITLLTDKLIAIDEWKADLSIECTREIQRVNEKVNSFSSELDEKIYGINKLMDLKVANLGDEDKKKAMLTLLSKISKMEEIKESAEHRRSTQELLDKLSELKDRFSEYDRKDVSTTAVKAQLDIINWVLGETNE